MTPPRPHISPFCGADWGGDLSTDGDPRKRRFNEIEEGAKFIRRVVYADDSSAGRASLHVAYNP